MITFMPTVTTRVDPTRIPLQKPDYPKKGNSQMTETDDEALKAEIDEIMSRVDTIMDKVARIIPEDKKETTGQE